MFKEWISDVTKYYDYVSNLEGFSECLIGNGNSDISIDRIDNNGNYEPGNLRWATKKQQANNRNR